MIHTHTAHCLDTELHQRILSSTYTNIEVRSINSEPTSKKLCIWSKDHNSRRYHQKHKEQMLYSITLLGPWQMSQSYLILKAHFMVDWWIRYPNVSKGRCQSSDRNYPDMENPIKGSCNNNKSDEQQWKDNAIHHFLFQAQRNSQNATATKTFFSTVKKNNS